MSLFTVGYYVGGMGDDRYGDRVVLDASRARINDGVTHIPVTSHRCWDTACNGEMLWDDGHQINAGCSIPGASCGNGCGFTFNTTTVEP